MPSANWERRYYLESWSDFKDLIGSVVSDSVWGADPENYWFRGHALASWPLKTSFDRVFADIGPARRLLVHQTMIAGLRDRLDFSEDPTLIEFRERLGLNEHSAARELAALAQHYGTPTRLLDWSESAYIAAFFAFADFPVGTKASDANEDEDTCSVIALDRAASAWNSDSGVLLVQTDRRMNARLRHQRAVFTLNSSTFSTLEEYCSEFYSGAVATDTALIRMTLPKAEAPAALRDLEMMGITSESMFPGMQGAARYALIRSVDRHIWRGI